MGKLLSSYIGLPLGASFKSILVYDLMVEYFKVRLHLWKMQFLVQIFSFFYSDFSS